MQIIKYTTEEEAEQIKQEKAAQGLILVEIANITEGNFLGFAEPTEQTATNTTDLETKINYIYLKEKGLIS